MNICRKSIVCGAVWTFRIALACVCTASAPFAFAQAPAGTAVAVDGPLAPVPPATVARSEDGRITMRATRLAEPLGLDGLLDEELYRSVPSATGFILEDPQPGEPATEQTEVWVFFDDHNVYISIWCADSQPDRIVANERRRDNNNIFQNDNVTIVLDTFYDRRSAYFFQTNPLGGVRDALIGSDGSTNYDWNTVWDVKSRRTSEGWSAEMMIPFKSLRYQGQTSQVWGFNIRRRVVGTTNETSLLAPAPRSAGTGGIFKLSYAATLVGLEAPSGSSNVELKPYAISNVTTNVATGIRNDPDASFGFDAKYGLTNSLTLDFTYNTDFAQVEIDEQQVNLTRFSLFFPEKREFFLEGQGVFQFAGSGAGQAGVTPVLFFSRRIGLEGGQLVPINVGARLTGRVGRTSVGALNIRTDDALNVGALATNFSVVRIRQDVLRKSTIGVLATNRSPAVAAGGTNQVYGVDANFAFFASLQLNGYYARSSPTRGDTESYSTEFHYDADRYGLDVEHLKVGKEFNPEVGFVRRRDFRRNYIHGRFSPRIRSIRGVRKLGWTGSVDRFVTSASVVETREAVGAFRVDFNNSDWFNVSYTNSLEFLTQPFRVAPNVVIPTGEYHFNEAQVQYHLGPQRVVSGTFSLTRGGYYTGDRTEAGYTGRIKLNPRLAVEPRVSRNWVDLPQGAFRLTLISARPTYTITPRMFASALVQYNSSTNSVETNARLRWEYTPGSDLFIVYTDARDTRSAGFPGLLNRGFAVKFTRLLRF